MAQTCMCRIAIACVSDAHATERFFACRNEYDLLLGGGGFMYLIQHASTSMLCVDSINAIDRKRDVPAGNIPALMKFLANAIFQARGVVAGHVVLPNVLVAPVLWYDDLIVLSGLIGTGCTGRTLLSIGCLVE